MVLPVDEPVEDHAELTGRDPFLLRPALLFKRDVIPGRTSSFTFTPTELGTYQSQCAEFCGLWHSRMTFQVKVVTSTDYQAWIEAAAQGGRGHHLRADGTDLSLVAHDISWNTFCLAVPADTDFTIEIDNQDSGHRAQLLDLRQLLRGAGLLTSPRITGPATESLDVQGLPPAATTSSATSTVPRCPGRSSSDEDADGRPDMAVTEAPSRELAPEPERGRLLDWLKTTDHKKIGILYLISSFAFFAVGGVFALLMRTELAQPGDADLRPHRTTSSSRYTAR